MKEARQKADEILKQFSQRLKQYTGKESITPEDCDEFMADVGKFGIAIAALLKDIGYKDDEISDFKHHHLDDLLRSSDVDYDAVINDPRFKKLFYGNRVYQDKPSNKLLTGLVTLVLGGSLLTNIVLYTDSRQKSEDLQGLRARLEGYQDTESYQEKPANELYPASHRNLELEQQCQGVITDNDKPTSSPVVTERMLLDQIAAARLEVVDEIGQYRREQERNGRKVTDNELYFVRIQQELDRRRERKNKHQQIYQLQQQNDFLKKALRYYIETFTGYYGDVK